MVRHVMVLISSKEGDTDQNAIIRVFLCWETACPTVYALSLWCPSMQGKWKIREMLHRLSSSPPSSSSSSLGGSWGLVQPTMRATAAIVLVLSKPLGTSEKLGTRSQLEKWMTFSSGEAWCPRSCAGSSGSPYCSNSSYCWVFPA